MIVPKNMKISVLEFSQNSLFNWLKILLGFNIVIHITKFLYLKKIIIYNIESNFFEQNNKLFQMLFFSSFLVLRKLKTIRTDSLEIFKNFNSKN